MNYLSPVDIQINGIFLGCFFAFAALILLCLKIVNQEKIKKSVYAVLSFLSFGIATFAVCGAIFNSEKLSLAIIILFGVSISLFSIDYLNTYKKCDVMVTAVLKKYHIRRSMPDVYTPIYTFEYNGKTYEVCDLQFYYKRKFFNLFEIGNNYNVFINSKEPGAVCVYKDVRNYAYMFGFLFSVIVIFCGVLIVVIA